MTLSRGSIRRGGPFQPRDISLAIVHRLPCIAGHCAAKSVLNLGCMQAPNTRNAIRQGRHLHLALVSKCYRLTGLDLDLTHRALLPPDDERHDIREADVCDPTQLAEAIAGRRYDVIVAGELLEHLPNPGLCLTALAQQLPRAQLIATVPNALAKVVATRAARGVERVHEDHVSWYSPRTICRLLEVCGWTDNTVYGIGTRTSYGRGNLRCPGLLVESRRR